MNYIIRFTIGFLLCLLISCQNNAKNELSQKNNDSIKKYLNLASNDTLPFPVRDKYNQKAFSFIDLKKNDTLTRYYLNLSSFHYVTTHDWNNYKKIAKIHFLKSIDANDTLNLARYYRYKAAYYKNIFKNDSAYYFYLKAEKFYKRTNDKYGLAKVLLNKASVQFNVNDLLGSELSANKALMIFKQKKDNYNIIQTKLFLMSTYIELLDYKNAHSFLYNLSNEIKKANIKDKDYIEARYNSGLGDFFDRIKDYKREKEVTLLALEYKNLKYRDERLYLECRNSILKCDFHLKNYNGFPNKIINIIKECDDLEYVSLSFYSRICLSDYYLSQKDTLNAEKIAQQAYEIAKSHNSPYQKLNGLRQIGFTDKDKAQECLKRYDIMIDSLLGADRVTRNQFYKIQLDTDEITKEKNTAKKETVLYSSVIAAALFIVILLFVVYRQQANKRELQLLNDQQKADENIYQLLLQQQDKEEAARQAEKKRIALELHDGIMNQLASTRINLSVLSSTTDPAIIANSLKYVNNISDIETEIRRIAHDLNKDVFKETNSFIVALHNFTKEQNQNHQTQYSLELEEKVNWEWVSSAIKMHLYRIIQEAVQNTNKYAMATKGTICIIQDENNVCMSISDNGIGFDQNKVKEGIGIKNMTQRIKSIKGGLTVASTLHKGTYINCSIPITSD